MCPVPAAGRSGTPPCSPPHSSAGPATYWLQLAKCQRAAGPSTAVAPNPGRGEGRTCSLLQERRTGCRLKLRQKLSVFALKSDFSFPPPAEFRVPRRRWGSVAAHLPPHSPPQAHTDTGSGAGRVSAWDACLLSAGRFDKIILAGEHLYFCHVPIF